jgi:hypothetical protein
MQSGVIAATDIKSRPKPNLHTGTTPMCCGLQPSYNTTSKVTSSLFIYGKRKIMKKI